MPWKGPVPKILCPECGEHMMYRRALKCRDCYRKAVAKALCPKCGGPMPNPNAERCWACFQAERTANRSQPTCIDCGKLISWQVGTGKDKKRPSRCWDCELKRRANVRDDELNRRRLAGMSGRRSDRDTDLTQNRPSGALRRYVGKLPCAGCGYDKLPSHLHRKSEGGLYVLENVIPLCVRCHTEVHAHLIPLPEFSFATD